MTYVLFDAGICGERLWECVACGSRRIRYWRPKRFHFTDGACREEFHIYRCEQCGTGFLNQPPSARWLQSIYSLSGQALTRTVTLEEILAKEARYPNCTVDAERIAGRVNRFDTSENGRALDIGSGFGFYTRALRKRGYHTVSINPGKYENAVFKELNGDDPLEVSFEAYYPCGSFGVVLMSQVLEHLLKPDKAIRKASWLLTRGGVLAIAVPNYNSLLVKLLGTRDNACLWVPEHVNYFTVKGLKALMRNNGLTVVKVEQVTRIPYDALSKRLGLKGQAAKIAEWLVKTLQAPFTRLMNFFGMGIYIHLYAVKHCDP